MLARGRWRKHAYRPQDMCKQEVIHAYPTTPFFVSWQAAFCRSEQGSYGYCSETGHKMNASPGQQRGVEYGQPYTTGDIVGAGIVLDRQEMFFT